MMGGLQSNFIKVFKIDAKQYNILFSAYTWPDFLLSIVGAIIIDRFIGKRIGLMVIATSLVVGIMIFITGLYNNSYITLVIGRFTLGLGIGSGMNVQNALVSVWFKDKLTFPMAVTFSTSRMGAALGLIVPPYIYGYVSSDIVPSSSNSEQLTLAFLVGLLLLIGAFIASLIVALLDYKGRFARPVLAAKKLSVSDLKDFSPKFWIAGIACNIFYGLFFTFVANGQLFLISKFRFSDKMANIANFLVFASPVLVTPFMGMLIQSIGFNVYWGIAGTVLALVSHALFNIIQDDYAFLPYLLAVVLALSYSFFGISIFPLPSLIVREHQLTTAYSFFGLLYCVIFSGISVSSGAVIDDGGYMWFEIYSFLLLWVVLALLIFLCVIDVFSKGKKVNRHGTGPPCRGNDPETWTLINKAEVPPLFAEISNEFVFVK